MVAQALQGLRQRADDHRRCATPSRAAASRSSALISDPRIKDLADHARTRTRAAAQYERFFEGRNNIDFSNDFIVIENEELKRRPDLHAVVNILLLHQITGEMYLTRNRRKVLFIDELKQQLGDIGADDPVKAAVVEEAARRARKYGGVARHRDPERRRLLRLGADGGGLQLLGLGLPAAPEARSPSKCSTARGA
ncbi:MAG: hypothetical protein MZW92_45040 [Comamonadaceae bacterium]|nr:hypothetical protein [Comamonadaceae bacterium]